MNIYAVAGLKRKDRVPLTKDISFYKYIVSDYFHIAVDKIAGKTRKREVVDARHIAMYLIIKNEKYSLKSIGIEFGGRDHTTVMHAKRAVEAMMTYDKEYSDTVTQIEQIIKTPELFMDVA